MTSHDADISFLGRHPSFSLIYFTRDVFAQVPELLRVHYSIVSADEYQATFFQAMDELSRGFGKEACVHKAVYRVPRGTVLVDPEMVVGAFSGDLAQFCTLHATDALVAIWERYSQSMSAIHVSGSGVQAEVVTQESKLKTSSENAPRYLFEAPGPESLARFLADAGAPTDEVFGNITGVAYLLKSVS
jgi:hypothetical protein